MPGDPVGVRSGAAVLLHYPRLLGQIENFGLHGRLLHRSIPRFSGGDSGKSSAPQYFQCGGGRSDVPLGLSGDRGSEMPLWVD